MTNFSIRAVVFLGICALAACAYGDLYGYSGSYAIGGYAAGYTPGGMPQQKNFASQDSLTDPTNVAIENTSGNESNNVISTGTVSVNAGNGKIGVYASAGMNVGPPTSFGFNPEGSVEAKGIAALADTLTIGYGAPIEVVMHAQLLLKGDLTPTVFGELTQGKPNDDRIDGDARASVEIAGNFIAVSQGPNPHQLGTAYGVAENGFSYGSGETEFLRTPPSVIFLDETFNVGVPQTIAYQLTVDTNALMTNYDDINKKSGSIFDVAGYGDTLSWGGITSITDTAGNPLTGWTVTSASGFDYTQAVPEPATFVLLAIALPGLLLARRRRFL